MMCVFRSCLKVNCFLFSKLILFINFSIFSIAVSVFLQPFYMFCFLLWKTWRKQLEWNEKWSIHRSIRVSNIWDWVLYPITSFPLSVRCRYFSESNEMAAWRILKVPYALKMKQRDYLRKHEKHSIWVMSFYFIYIWEKHMLAYLLHEPHRNPLRDH